MPQDNSQPRKPFYQPRTINQILWGGLKLYQKYWLALTLPLLSPFLKIFFGVVLWLALPITVFNILGNINPVILAICFVAANIPGAWLFFGGFWRYLLFLSAQSQMVRNVMEQGYVGDVEAMQFKVACRGNDYAMMCVILMFIWLLPFLLFLLTTGLVSFVTQNALIGFAIGVFTLVATAFLMLVFTLFFSMSFQCFMFQPDKLGAVLMSSFDLVRKDFWKVTLVGFISFMATQNVLPTLITCLLDWTGIINFLAIPLTPAVSWYTQNISTSVTPNAIIVFLQTHTSMIAGSIIELVITLSLALLLIPLGACWYTLLYADLKQRHG